MGVLLLVRHGQASFGADDYDVLSDLGRRQAEVLAERLAPAAGAVQRVRSGGLVRQRATAEVLHAGLRAAGAPLPDPVVDPRWDEYDALDVLTGIPVQPEDGLDSRAFQRALDRGLARWTSGEHDGDYREPWPAFRDRVGAALAEAAAGPGTTVVVSSAGTIGAASALALGAPPAVFAALARTAVNTAVTKLVSGRSGTSLVTVNDHAHVEGRPDLLTYR